MTRYRVLLDGPGISLGGLGRARSQWSYGCDAPDAAAAVAEARRVCAETFDSRYADGRATVQVVHRWKIVLRGKADKRRRETFYVHGIDEHEARRHLQYNESVYRFAGRVPSLAQASRAKRPVPDPVVKIERL